MLKRLTLLPLILSLSVNAYAEDAPAPSEAASSAAAKALSHAADALTHAAEALKLASEAFQQALEAERKAEEMLAKANEKPVRPGDALPDGTEDLWAKRGDEVGLRAFLDELEKRSDSDTSDLNALVWLSRGYYLMGDAYVGYEDDAREDLLATFTKGMEYGMQAMRLIDPAFATAVDAGTPVEDATVNLTDKSLGAIYWYAVNLGKFAGNKDFPTLLFYKATIKGLMDRALEIDELYFYGAFHRYFGAYYAKAPAFAGGDMGKSKYHFDRALEIEPNYFATRVLVADYYAKKTEDTDLFERQLNTVLDTDPASLPEIEVENRLEQRKAKVLLENMDEIF